MREMLANLFNIKINNCKDVTRLDKQQAASHMIAYHIQQNLIALTHWSQNGHITLVINICKMLKQYGVKIHIIWNVHSLKRNKINDA